jgi:hypothetical protein
VSTVFAFCFLKQIEAASTSRQVSNNQILVDDVHLTDIDPAFEGRVLSFNKHAQRI